MLKHETIWAAIDALAERNGLTPSALARKAGLDPTAFNPSKRRSADGRARWPSTESIAKVLTATGASLEEFTAAITNPLSRLMPPGAPVTTGKGFPLARQVPLLGFAQAGVGGFFEDSGYPAGSGWDEIDLPALEEDGSYALEVQGDSMLPLYRDGDIIVVSPAERIRKGDRIVVKTTDGEVMAKVLKRRTASQVELMSLNPDHEDRVLALTDIEWMARIIWASQ
ncbi:MAG: helix-turn-helix transcriptional regulator [Hyphomicrobiales bacterium]|nr:helix-turn-helix transcriptional regulator [Hyphomicrobiales bacterium]